MKERKELEKKHKKIHHVQSDLCATCVHRAQNFLGAKYQKVRWGTKDCNLTKLV